MLDESDFVGYDTENEAEYISMYLTICKSGKLKGQEGDETNLCEENKWCLILLRKGRNKSLFLLACIA